MSETDHPKPPAYDEAKALQYALTFTPPELAREQMREALAKRITVDDYVARTIAWGAEKGWNEELCRQDADGQPMTDPARCPIDPDVPLVAMKIALMHSELSEALEEVRKGAAHYPLRLEDGKPEGVVVELADTIIRIFHFAGLLGLDLQGALEAKLGYNDRRPFRHGGKKA